MGPDGVGQGNLGRVKLKGRYEEMRKRNALIKVFISFMFIVVSTSGAVEIPNTFRAGDKARASEVNENFNAVKNAIDILEAIKDAMIPSLCDPDQAIVGFDGFGSPICRGFVNSDFKYRSITIHSSSCVAKNKDHRVIFHDDGYIYPDTSSPVTGTVIVNCSIPIPEGVTLKQIIVKADDQDTSGTGNIVVNLKKIDYLQLNPTSIIGFNSGADLSGFIMTSNLNEYIDRGDALYLEVAMWKDSGTQLKFFSATIIYEYNPRYNGAPPPP